MKSIEDIENISLEALESISTDSLTDVPASLGDKVGNILAANAVISSRKGRSPVTSIAIPVLSFAAATALALFVFLPHEPDDTFDDPLMAYAELEKTFAYISSKVYVGIDIAEETEPLIKKTVSYSEKITIK